MENGNKKMNTNPFYTAANRLLRMKIRTIEDAIKFYVGVNNLAAQISSDSTAITGLGSRRYDDNPKLFKAIIHILAYGQVIGKTKLFAQKVPTTTSAVKKVNLDAFVKKNSEAKRKIKNIQEEATTYFNALEKIGEEFTKEDRENIKITKKMVEELYKQLMFKPQPQKKKHTVKLILPETARWEKVVLKMKDGLEDIEILYDGKHIKMASYIELGFSANKKNHKPDRKWRLLTMLSVLQNKDITRATPDNLKPMLEGHGGRTIKKDTVHQTKKLLSEALKAIFETKENPFADNKKYYEPKFKILPEPALRREEVWSPRLQENRSHEPKFISDKDSETSYENSEE